MKKGLCLIILCSFFLVNCSEDNTQGPDPDSNDDSTTGDSIATYYYNEMGDMIRDMEDMDEEQVRDMDFQDVRDGFGEATETDTDNGIAHFGLSVLEILELNYRSELWAVIDSINYWSGEDLAALSQTAGRRRLLGNQFSLLAQIPFALSVNQIKHFPQNLEIHALQGTIENIIIPALDNAVAHLRTVEDHNDVDLTLHIEDEGITSTYIIDMGEILFFDATVHALRAAFKMAVAYDMDLYDPQGTYDWVMEMDELDDDLYCPSFSINTGTQDTLKLFYGDSYNEARADSLMLYILHHNLVNRESFMALRDGKSVMESASDDIIATLNKLESSVEYIRERDEQSEHNVIKITDLTELDQDIPGPDSPNFAAEFQTVEDVLTWLRDDFLSDDGYTFTEDFGPRDTPYSIEICPIVLLDGTINDWKELLPKHQWDIPDSGNWLEREVNGPYYCYPPYSNWWGGYVQTNNHCEYRDFYIDQVCEYGVNYNMIFEPLILLDDSDNPLDMESVDFPYFDNYTFKGLFPEMDTRQEWLDFVEILED